MKKVLSTLPGFALLLAFPVVAAAYLENVKGLVVSGGDIVDTGTPIVVGIGLLVFFWGLAKSLANSDDSEARKEGRAIMVAGVLILFVMVSVWGLVRFIGSAVNIDQGDTIEVPRVQDL